MSADDIQLVPLGPFVGGLNINEGVESIQDNQLVACLNLDIGRSGELITRTGFKTATGAVPPWGTTSKEISIPGIATMPDGYSRLYIQSPSDAVPNIYFKDQPNLTSSTGLTAVTSAVGNEPPTYSEATIQYTNRLWFVPKNTVNAGRGGFHDVSVVGSNPAFVRAPGIPLGSGAVLFKERMFIWGAVDTASAAPQYRVYYSAATDLTLWPAANFFDVSPGDGEPVTSIIVSGDTLIIFKARSTYALFFDGDPGLGVLRKVNSEVGATTPASAINLDNITYVLGQKSVYRLVNLQFEDIGLPLMIDSLRLSGAALTRDSLSIQGSRVICHVGISAISTGDRYFVWNTEVSAWSEYSFAFGVLPSRFYRAVTSVDIELSLTTLMGPQANNTFYFMRPQAALDDTAASFDGAASSPSCSLITKFYDFGNVLVWKRIFWWVGDFVSYGAGTPATVQMLSRSYLRFDSLTGEENSAPLQTNVALALSPSLIKVKHARRCRRVQFQVVIPRASGTKRTVFLSGMLGYTMKRGPIKGVTIT